MMNLEKFSKAFSDKNRIKIIDYLTAGQKNVSEIADRLNVEENLASHHLRVLASLGFLKSDKKGREVFYRLNDTKFITLIKDLKKNPAFKEIFLKAFE
jgi:ArsR family transcriptional regulator